jgi:predicted DNA-binding transcriptional regulator YafY
MATNKHAAIRYQALDRCFSNPHRHFFIDDLIDACNKAIYEYAGVENGVKRRQIFDDIVFMESEQGWSIQLDRIRDGKRVYYRYSDTGFSINQSGITALEVERLNETLLMLSRFKGLPQFQWIDELRVRLESTFGLKGEENTAISFDSNPYLKGVHHIHMLFTAISEHFSLIVEYKSYKEAIERTFIFHPWYLKQYNNRWFVFGIEDEQEGLVNLALDRIKSLEHAKSTYKRNEHIDFEEYFEDVVGVTVRSELQVEKVRLFIKQSLWPYIASKPMHGSQKVLEDKENGVIIELRVRMNHELRSLLFSYMDGIIVLEPVQLREDVSRIAEQIFKLNSSGI